MRINALRRPPDSLRRRGPQPRGTWAPRMCFSPTASFITAGLTGAASIVTLSRVSSPREIPLAATPLLFALQQALEGVLWLTLPMSPGGAQSGTLVLSYLLIAESFWPLFASLAVLLVEGEAGRRCLMIPWLAVGAGVSAYLLWGVISGRHDAFILNSHIAYVTQERHPLLVSALYIAAISVPLLMSSLRTVAVFGVIVLIGCTVALIVYREAFVSVWCFFAATASVALLYHFQQAPRAGLATT